MAKTRYSIVGQKHCGAKPYNEGVLPGTPVILVRESDNAVDPWAVQVWLGGAPIGYLAAKGGVNVLVAKFIDANGRDQFRREDTSSVAEDAAIVPFTVVKAIDAIFVRSPNTSYPQVEVDL